MKTLEVLVAATLAALSASAVAAPNCPAGAADCGPGAGQRGAAVQERLKAADTNNDGVISREEARALPRIAAHFDAIDANRDGQVTAEELRAHHQAQRAQHRGEMWKKLDANGDGRISRDEAASRPRLAKDFDAIDADKDGFLSAEEIQAARGRHVARLAPKS